MKNCIHKGENFPILLYHGTTDGGADPRGNLRPIRLWQIGYWSLGYFTPMIQGSFYMQDTALRLLKKYRAEKAKEI